MTDQSTDMERELRDLREENELLLLQLHQVQEELESYYLRNLELERRGSDSRGAKRSSSAMAEASEDTLRRLQRRYEEIRDSTSWRLTRPIRVVMRVLLRKGRAPSPPGKHASLSERARFYERRVQQLENSTSWKLTRPYRLIGDVLRHGPGVLFGRRVKEQLTDARQRLESANQTISDLESGRQDDQQARRHAERSAQQSQQDLTVVRRELGEHRQQIDRLAEDLRSAESQIAAKDTELSESRAEVDAKATENSELQRRQALMNEELAKAEAKVDLIKDLLARGGPEVESN